MSRSACACALLLAASLVAPAAFGAGNGPGSNAPGGVLLPVEGAGPPVSLTINPDGTAVWNGEPLAGVPELKNKLARRSLQDPKLELDLFFHSAPGLTDSNRQTLLEVLQLAAQFGFVHLEATDSGARLILLGPTASKTAPK
jgi:hypothetical protein